MVVQLARRFHGDDRPLDSGVVTLLTPNGDVQTTSCVTQHVRVAELEQQLTHFTADGQHRVIARHLVATASKNPTKSLVQAQLIEIIWFFLKDLVLY